LIIFFKADSTWGVDVEELMRFRGEGNDVVGPAAVIAAARIGDEDDLRLAGSVEVLTGVLLVKNHAEPGSAKQHVAGLVVIGRGALVASALAVARRAERNLVSVPKFFRVGLVLRFRNAIGAAGELALQVLRLECWLKR